jgi:hypothetical protein
VGYILKYGNTIRDKISVKVANFGALKEASLKTYERREYHLIIWAARWLLQLDNMEPTSLVGGRNVAVAEESI